MTAAGGQALLRLLRQWELRLRMAESINWGLWGAIGGAGAGLLMAVAARIWPLLLTRGLIALAGTLILTGAAVGLTLPLLRPRPPLRLARLFDRRLGLAERLTTALELSTGRIRTTQEMARAQMADTLRAARNIDVQTLLPLQASRGALAALGILLLGLMLSLWLPNPQEQVLLQRAALAKTIEEQREQLDALRETIVQTEGLSDADREALLQALEEAINALDKERPSPEEAVATLSEVERKLAELRDPGAAGLRAGMERAAAGMADSRLTRGISEALAQGDYRRAAQALAAYSGTEGVPLTREEELELAHELEQAAQELADTAPELSQELAQAAQAIRQGDIPRAREAIRRAAQQMGAVGERIAREETVERTQARLQESRRQLAEASGTQPGPTEAVRRGATGGQPGAERPGGQAPGRAGHVQQPEVDQPGTGSHDDTGSGAPYDEVYVPYRLGEEGVELDIGRTGEGEPPAGTIPVPFPDTGQAGVPYRQVYAEYAARAGAALESAYIPLGLKQYVRDYFSALEP
ncbi:MAG: hypothetical protein N2508_13505 [Anaerolineae bacterium]|nr:hypothetical protein [Anaerolineae bacterium]